MGTTAGQSVGIDLGEQFLDIDLRPGSRRFGCRTATGESPP